ncbi:hypothetical protein NPIL_460071 [Nephila pilipes]|uniref:Uncharacterized protein n=1 Tax=Nephila pilipes TaxID=299642 RepID=A0A8X6ULU7_NEPPI|nr:hypothetical protein NPIL_460071 [Nephila pilipes]
MLKAFDDYLKSSIPYPDHSFSTCTAGIEAAPSATTLPPLHFASSTYPDRLVEERLHARESHALKPVCVSERTHP